MIIRTFIIGEIERNRIETLSQHVIEQNGSLIFHFNTKFGSRFRSNHRIIGYTTQTHRNGKLRFVIIVQCLQQPKTTGYKEEK